MIGEGKVCSSEGCENTVTGNLACPKCKTFGQFNYFCTQECFKKNWATHKAVHSLYQQMATSKVQHRKMPPDGGREAPSDAPREVQMMLPDWAHDFRFRGDLRPARLSPFRTVPDNIRRPDYANDPAGIAYSEQQDKANHNNIRIYTSKELDGEFGLRHACRMGREVLDAAGKALRVGVTTDEIDRVVHEASIERDCYPSPLNYYNFPKSVCTSVNEIVCHGIPDYREVQDGDIVNIDISVYNRGGYHGDLNETFCVGNVDADGKMLVKTAFDSLASAIDLVKPGTLYRDFGNAIHKVAHKNKCSVVRTYCGHGIGSLFHTIPNVPHYKNNKGKGIVKPGHVFTIEPMINRGTYDELTWGDNWTSTTADGKRSAQFEHTILATETGYELLTARDNEPVMTWDEDLISR